MGSVLMDQTSYMILISPPKASCLDQGHNSFHQALYMILILPEKVACLSQRHNHEFDWALYKILILPSVRFMGGGGGGGCVNLVTSSGSSLYEGCGCGGWEEEDDDLLQIFMRAFQSASTAYFFGHFLHIHFFSGPCFRP